MNAPADPRVDWLAALAWQVELGADEAIGETPVDRFEEAARESAGALRAEIASPPPEVSPCEGRESGALPARSSPSGVAAQPSDIAHAPATGAPPNMNSRAGGPAAPAAGEDARGLAQAAATLEELAAIMRDWPGSALREGARNLVFADGLPGARVMVIGEAPGSEEDRVGRPFVGRAGQLLDRMLAAVGLSRTAPAPESAAYITNTLPWRPIGNRTPADQEALKFLPFLERHIQLARPDIILAVGGVPTKALLGTTAGIKRTRGQWHRHAASGLPVMPTLHPAYLLRTPEDKRLAWRDLLAVRRALDGDTS